MEYFEIEGGHKLKGEIIPQGAKNEALEILCATLLTAETVTISRVPDILDVVRLTELLGLLGSEVTRVSKDTWTFNGKNVDPERILDPAFRSLAQKLRGSFMILGPLIARFGKAWMPLPGGDKIGRRRIDTHLYGLKMLGAQFDYDAAEGFFKAWSDGRLKGTTMLLDEPSVTGTANIIMAAVLAKGTTTIYYAACEPYIQQLCKMLNRMGAKITGIGSNLLHIEGVHALGGTEHKLLADMIEVGSFIGMAAMTQSSLRIPDADASHLGQIPDVFRRLGIDIDVEGEGLVVRESKVNEIQTFVDGSILTVADNPWPGFTPDLLSIVLVVATQCRGTVLIHQKMFESRLFFVDKLIDMGAQIILCDPHRANVIGLGRKQKLRATTMSSPDIRAGVALLIAAMSAEGKSKIFNIEQIDRGYQDIENRLNALGAKITRKE